MFLRLLVPLLAILSGAQGHVCAENSCTSFTVGSGTGCAWMCNYCAETLGTSNYYFTTDVCKYEPGGCVGNPQAGVTYTCCAS